MVGAAAPTDRGTTAGETMPQMPQNYQDQQVPHGMRLLMSGSAPADFGLAQIGRSLPGTLVLLMVSERLLPFDTVFIRRLSALKLEHGLAAAGFPILAGLAGTGHLLGLWSGRAFGNLDPFFVMRMAIPSVTAITLGLQGAFAALFLSLLKWQIRSRSSP